ncbi:LysR family transcriptional regulator [Phenylobacterium sp. J426]|uniref:LysR family transcriptional regulator n=1 Tax=Phenylobacterium sp. J426 TaxID=2898439 RepID=UPI002150810D|nr:LysR family transcriptional regulator [Phenylobacterium sp. J426]MCR5874033.1 LysR family transcriptional regulator [Phenylobacterium sp. J426]
MAKAQAASLQAGSAQLQSWTMYDWNDLKAFLAVARGGSTLAAAKALGVNQTTVARRIESLEAALALKLFERGQTGSRLTEAGKDLVAEAERVEHAAERFGNRAAGHQRGLAGVIRVTSTEMIANLMLMPGIVEFRKTYPEIQTDLIITDRPLDIQAGEADVAIRSGAALAMSDLIARKLGDHEFALYCSRDYVARMGLPTPETLCDHDLIGGELEMAEGPGMAWMFRMAGGKAPVSRSNTLNNLLHAIKAGLGVGPMACQAADLERDLIRCSEPIEEARGSTWIVTRRDLKDTPRVRAFLDFFVPYLQEMGRMRAERGRRMREQAEAANDAALAEGLGEAAP